MVFGNRRLSLEIDFTQSGVVFVCDFIAIELENCGFFVRFQLGIEGDTGCKIGSTSFNYKIKDV